MKKKTRDIILQNVSLEALDLGSQRMPEKLKFVYIFEQTTAEIDYSSYAYSLCGTFSKFRSADPCAEASSKIYRGPTTIGRLHKAIPT